MKPMPPFPLHPFLPCQPAMFMPPHAELPPSCLALSPCFPSSSRSCPSSPPVAHVHLDLPHHHIPLLLNHLLISHLHPSPLYLHGTHLSLSLPHVHVHCTHVPLHLAHVHVHGYLHLHHPGAMPPMPSIPIPITSIGIPPMPIPPVPFMSGYILVQPSQAMNNTIEFEASLKSGFPCLVLL